jgi:tRNA(Ser,Leu) C12 N-acetylase TAN1
MGEWNVVITVNSRQFVRACQLMEQYGRVERTSYYNVLVMKVDDTPEFLARMEVLTAHVPDVLDVVSRVVPVALSFEFQTAEEFEARARQAVLKWTSELVGKSFHVRLHRRGFKHELSSQQEERLLDEILVSALEAAGTPGSISFDDPDAIIDVEIIGHKAGMSCWTRDDLRRYPFLKLD